ncbi:hypothetical protein DPMN_165646 [Dreissena polymorpha]|uniref:Uncharacterized protein n=1 Tax=Dreissena polymorpha TaxID=45954 RepID=A0A9D4IWT9_DREPO|nr:hypothetical protein DPMN_165646 [Dreissena polymorpha]
MKKVLFSGLVCLVGFHTIFVMSLQTSKSLKIGTISAHWTTRDFIEKQQARSLERGSSSNDGFKQETFNRPIGTRAFVVDDGGMTSLQAGEPFEIQDGRVSGQYGSYRKHKSWIEAVKKDIARNIATSGNGGVGGASLSWMMRNMNTPAQHSFDMPAALWNSYAVAPDKESKEETVVIAAAEPII